VFLLWRIDLSFKEEITPWEQLVVDAALVVCASFATQFNRYGPSLSDLADLCRGDMYLLKIC